ncbi:MAG: putative bifunctional diguanylate cyclase/phosphodiesterase [Lysobacter sp.]
MALHPAPWPAAGTPEEDARGTARNAPKPAIRHPSTAEASDDDGNEFDDLVCMASQLLDSPIALIALAEGEQFRMVAERGLGVALVPREHAICRAVGYDTPLLVVPDAAADARFRDDPAVACTDGVRFYLGIALIGSTGLLLGVLSVADRQPRASISDAFLATLERLARLATRLIERHAFERSNRIAEQIARADFSAVVVVNAVGAVTFANAAAQAVFGPAVAGGQPVAALFPAALQLDPDAVAGWLRTGASAAHDAGAASRELRVRATDGELRTLEAVRCAWLGDEDGETCITDSSSVFALILRDITDRRRLPQRRRRADQQDPLTGLPNRATLLTTLDALRARTATLGVALLGLNNFRAVNDTLGHAIGDAVLQVVACRLLARLPADAHLARFDGDEFVLVFADTAVETIEALLATMLRELARPCEVDHQRVHLEASIGLAMSDVGNGDGEGDRVDGRELVARAGLAMQHAKRANGQQLRHFRPDMRTAAIDRRLLDLELRRASREGEFELHYQPQIDLATGLPTGAEALLRWRHPERGLLLPIAFIDALAHSAVALAVGRWVLQRACRDAAAWPEVGGRRLAVGVNLFPVQFDDEHLLDEVDHALVLSGLPPAQLELELTETIALHDDGVAEHALAQLRARGIRVAYDDFGTGFASLSMLHRLPVDRVKIDRSFVRNVMDNRGDEAIVRSIALIARNFDLEVIAEGVETLSQAEFLRTLGCQDVQGWLYSKALAPGDFDRWLADHVDASPARALTDG